MFTVLLATRARRRFTKSSNTPSIMCYVFKVRIYLFIEEVKRDIGYNLIITKGYIMVVPLVDPYEVYNGMKLYIDGLAYLGCIHTAKLSKPYQIVHPTSTE